MQQGHERLSRVRRRLVAAGAAIAVVALGTTSVLGAGSAQATATSSLHLVPGYLPGLSRATLLAPAPAAMRMEIGVGISRPDPAGEVKLYNELYDLPSKLYHHFLTVSEFNARFGVKPATTAAVRQFLTGAGLAIDTSSPDGNYFTATGTVSQLDRLFKVQIGRYTLNGTRFFANNAAPSVPLSLPIDAIAGLDTVHKMTLADLKGRTLAHGHAANAVAAGRQVLARQAALRATGVSTTSQSGDEQVYTPQDLWGIYDDPGAAALTSGDGTSNATTVAGSSTALGQGQVIGIFGDGETSSVTAQLRLFETAEGLPKVPVRTVETEGSDDSKYGDNTGAIEWYLDSQSSTGMAPDAKQLDFFFGKSIFDADVAADFDYWANDANGPKEMNASFGECEENPTNPVTGPLAQQPYGSELGDELEALAEPMLRQATIEGRTLFSSAGDTGSGCPEAVVPVAGGANGLAIQPVPIVSYPCASDYDVCVGGTVVSSPGDKYPDAAKRSAETSWTYGGGGTSYFITAPSFQDGVAGVTHDCVSTPDGTTVYSSNAPLCRGVPDVADLSGNTDGDGYFIYIDSQPSSEGGTSLASPLMMGQWARIQSAAPASEQSSGGLGYANPLIYKEASSADKCTTAPCAGTYASDFNDITQSEDIGDTTGTAGAPTVSTGIGIGNGVYSDGPGWDYASGWGSLNVANFMQSVDGDTTATDAYTGAEQAAEDVCEASMSSPSGNATDPVDVSLGNEPGVDLTGATLTATKSTITATLTVPTLSSGVPTDSLDDVFNVAWLYAGKVYTATAEEGKTGGWTFSDSSTALAANDDPTTSSTSSTTTPPDNATGSVNTTTGVITIKLPTTDVGSPPAGALLIDPQAFDAISADLSFTTDSADTLRAYSVDAGQLDSIGVDVVVGGSPGSSCASTLPTTNLTTADVGGAAVATPVATPPAGSSCQTTSAQPVTRITSKSLTKRALKLAGTSKAHCPDTITKVTVAIAQRVKVGHRVECRFLTAKHRWSAAGSCAPRDYLSATGTSIWTFSLKLHFTAGTYRVWEHATDSKGKMTKNTASKYVTFHLR